MPRRRVTHAMKWQRLRFLIEDMMKQRIVLNTGIEETLRYTPGTFTVGLTFSSVINGSVSGELMNLLAHEAGHWLASTAWGRKRKDFGIDSMGEGAADCAETKACYMQKAILHYIGAEKMARAVTVDKDARAKLWWNTKGRNYLRDILHNNHDPRTNKPLEGYSRVLWLWGIRRR